MKAERVVGRAVARMEETAARAEAEGDIWVGVGGSGGGEEEGGALRYDAVVFQIRKSWSEKQKMRWKKHRRDFDLLDLDLR
jgi:hypothetical protein